MGATTLALARRRDDVRFAERWFVGDALDVGDGNDLLGLGVWPRLTSCRGWDVCRDPDEDAVHLPGLAPASFDVVYSSHCLEHLVDWPAALRRWWEVLRPGGVLVVVVPDFVLYEREIWPSTHNGDHKTTWTTASLRERVVAECAGASVERLALLDAHFHSEWAVAIDQTCAQGDEPACECGVEIVARKP